LTYGAIANTLFAKKTQYQIISPEIYTLALQFFVYLCLHVIVFGYLFASAFITVSWLYSCTVIGPVQKAVSANVVHWAQIHNVVDE